MKRFFMYTLAMLLIALQGTAMASEVLKVNTSIKPPFSTKAQTGFIDLLIKELGRRMGWEMELVRQPPERALLSANAGFSDIELPRIGGLQKTYPNLIQIEEKVIDYHFVAFSRFKKPLPSWDGLIGERVGYLIGWKIFESNVSDSAAITKLRRPDQLFEMLDQGRIDVALYERYAGWARIRSQGYDSIKECEPPLATRPMYMYIHASRKNLADAITHHLRAMKADGTYQQLSARTLNR